jgi:hypothetical protein
MVRLWHRWIRQRVGIDTPSVAATFGLHVAIGNQFDHVFARQAGHARGPAER